MRRSTSLALLLLAPLASLAAAAPLAAKEAPKTVILGFDGADAKLTEQWMNEGKLPNLARLRAEGTFAPLRSTIPSQTPVSWSTFATGLNPGPARHLRLPEARHQQLPPEASPRARGATSRSCGASARRPSSASPSACCCS